jgi:hypothetical protein
MTSMSDAEVGQSATQKSPWNNLSTLLLVVPYAVALAFAYRFDALFKYDGRRWDDIPAELLGDGIQTGLLWSYAVFPLVLCAIVAVVATLSDALRGKPLQPVAAFSYGVFLFVTWMLASLSVTGIVGLVDAHKDQLSTTLRLAVGLLTLVLFLAVLYLLMRKPISRSTAFNLGVVAVTSAGATILLGILSANR